MKKIILTAAFLFIVMMSFGQVTICGHVWNDANGLTDLQINNSGGSYSITNGLNVYLVNPANNEILQAVHSTFEEYTFYNVPENTSYKIVMSWTVANQDDICPAVALHVGWIIVGENIGAGIFSGHDGTPNGMLLVDVYSSDISECNFGIKQYP